MIRRSIACDIAGSKLRTSRPDRRSQIRRAASQRRMYASSSIPGRGTFIYRVRGTVGILAIAFATSAWAQTAAPVDQAASQPAHTDEIVKMRMEVAAANKKYNQKVAAAKEVFDHKKVEAAKERDAAIAAAHNGVSGQ